MAETTKDPSTGRNPAGELLTFVIGDEIGRVKADTHSSTNDRFAHTLAKHRDMTVTMMLLRKGAHLHEHQAHGSIALHMLSGSIRFRARDDERQLTAGTLAVLDAQVPHSVEALEDSVILLTAAL